MSDVLMQTSGDAMLLSTWKAKAGQNSLKIESAHPEARVLYWEALRLKVNTVGARAALDAALSQLNPEYV